MKLQQRAKIDKNLTTIEQILFNRNMNPKDAYNYLNTTDEIINSPLLFGEDKLKKAAAALIRCVKDNLRAVIIIDSDCDGYTSSALLINYLYCLFPSWVNNNLDWFLHEGKQHGLRDFEAAAAYGLIICPDAASNDYSEHLEFADQGIPVLILDHHEAEITSPNAIVINNQLSNYPNKNLSGVGIVWQFCRYLDYLLHTNHANNFIDLVALGNVADMMDIREPETKHLIFKGLQQENLHNPFIVGMSIKNSYLLGEHITPRGAAFYIAPFVNAMVRSGTQEEKELLFRSMLNHEAGTQILSTKRGHKPGEMETILDQAIRTATNVKNRQAKAQDDGLELLEDMIEKDNLLNHKVLFFKLKPNQVDKNIAGLIANKFMAKYQRPVCILMETKDEDGKIVYQGSARGCDLAGVSNFKDICESTKCVEYAQGHQGAFGLGVSQEDINGFINKTDTFLQNMSSDVIYYVDYLYNNVNINYDQILEIASLNDLWIQDSELAYIGIENLKVSPDMVTVYTKKNLTLKITLPNKISIMLFDAPEDLCEKLQSNTNGCVVMDIVGKCNINEWYGNITPQIMIKDYEIKGENKWFF